MTKWFAYIVFLLLLTPCLPSAAKSNKHYIWNVSADKGGLINFGPADTVIKSQKKQREEEKKRIKEIGKARRQPKPEKIVTSDAPATPKTKPKRQRRPEGLERPPEIPRRNGG